MHLRYLSLPVSDGRHNLSLLPQIRTFEWIVQFLTRLNTSRKWNTKFNPVDYEDGDKDAMKDELFAIRGKLRDELNIDVGISNGELEQSTGGAFKTLSSDAGRKVLKEMVDIRDGDDASLPDTFDWIFLRLSAIVIVMNSSKKKIDLQKYNKLCKDVSLKIVQEFPWVRISESIHRVLCHSGEFIERNQGKGLGGHSEEVRIQLVPVVLMHQAL